MTIKVGESVCFRTKTLAILVSRGPQKKSKTCFDISVVPGKVRSEVRIKVKDSKF